MRFDILSDGAHNSVDHLCLGLSVDDQTARQKAAPSKTFVAEEQLKYIGLEKKHDRHAWFLQADRWPANPVDLGMLARERFEVKILIGVVSFSIFPEEIVRHVAGIR